MVVVTLVPVLAAAVGGLLGAGQNDSILDWIPLNIEGILCAGCCIHICFERTMKMRGFADKFVFALL